MIFANIKKLIFEVKEEYEKIIFPSFFETLRVTLLMVFIIVLVSISTDLADKLIGSIFNLIMF